MWLRPILIWLKRFRISFFDHRVTFKFKNLIPCAPLLNNRKNDHLKLECHERHYESSSGNFFLLIPQGVLGESSISHPSEDIIIARFRWLYLRLLNRTMTIGRPRNWGLWNWDLDYAELGFGRWDGEIQEKRCQNWYNKFEKFGSQIIKNINCNYIFQILNNGSRHWHGSINNFRKRLLSMD